MEETKSIEQTIKGIITGIVHCNEDVITRQATWKDTGADSLDFVQIVSGLEESFEIEIPEEDVGKLTNFGEAVTYIEQHQSR